MSNDHSRKIQLQEVAARSLLGQNKAVAARDILKVAARFVSQGHLSSPAGKMMEDLKAVMIGKGYADFTGRGEGPYYVCNHPLLKKASNAGAHKGSDGFLPWYSDSGFQVHHVMAALEIGYNGGALGQAYAIFSEKADIGKRLDGEIEWWDIAVYEDICPIGRALNDQNYLSLGERVYSRLTRVSSAP